MKPSVPLVVAISAAVLLLIGLVYLDIQLGGANGEINALKGETAQLSGQVASMQKSVDAIASKSKEIDSVIGAQGTLPALAKQIEGGEMDLSLKSLKIVSGGKTLISIGANGDKGGLIEVRSSDGASTAQLSSFPGASTIWFRSSTGPDAAPTVHIATYGDDGFYLQKGPSDDPTARTDGAGLRILDPGSSLFMTQSGGGNVSIDTTSADERAKISVAAEGDPKKAIDLSLGTKDDGPFVAIAGALSGNSLRLVPDRLYLSNKAGSVVLAAAADDNGGFVFVNDSSGSRRAIMTAGEDGHGSISVYGNDKRSNTLFPEYNIQQPGSPQK